MKGFGWVTSGLLAALLLGSACAQAETLVMEADVWCPVNCAQDAERPGIFIELATQIFAEAGIQVEYRVTNWARAVQDVRTGRANALVGAVHRPGVHGRSGDHRHPDGRDHVPDR